MPDLTEPQSQTGAPPSDDLLQPFIIEGAAIRGRLIRLGPVADAILSRHRYPEPVAKLLGELLALTAALASLLKFDGVCTLQTKGDGAIRLMVADITSEGDLRGYAEFDHAQLELVTEEGAVAEPSVARLLGSGYLAFTVDQGEKVERHQGIVELNGATLAECLHHYFRQSDQIHAAILLASGRWQQDWRAGGLILQRMPEGDGQNDLHEGEAEDAWRRTLAFMASCSTAELTDPSLSVDTLLYRLFHEDGVRVFTPRPLHDRCHCSRDRVTDMLAAMPRAEIEELKVDGEVVITCQFCSRDYRFDDQDLAGIYSDS